MKSATLKKLRNLLLLVFCLLLGMTVAYTLQNKPQSDLRTLGSQLGGNFTMQAQSGPVSLTDFKGKVSVLYIGYASCPDVCPTALGVLATALYQLPEHQQNQIQPLFISVDPERDTPEKLAQYSQFFYPTMIGMTGNRDQIDQVVKQYGAFYRIYEMENSAMGYSVDHSSRLYIIDQQGQLVETALHNTTPDQLISYLNKYLQP